MKILSAVTSALNGCILQKCALDSQVKQSQPLKTWVVTQCGSSAQTVGLSHLQGCPQGRVPVSPLETVLTSLSNSCSCPSRAYALLSWSSPPGWTKSSQEIRTLLLQLRSLGPGHLPCPSASRLSCPPMMPQPTSLSQMNIALLFARR